MDYVGLEERYLTCYKFLDGIDISGPAVMGSACDLSFNDGITAGYLLSRGEFATVYLPFLIKPVIPGLLPLDMSAGLVKGLSSVICDYVISVGGTFNFLPMDDVARGVYNSLRIGGKFLFGVFPQVFDDGGRDLLELYSRENKLNISRKLNRLTTALFISFGRYFPETSSSSLIADTTADEVKDFFRAGLSYEFRSAEEFESFFGRLNDSSRLYMAWRIVYGIKI